MKTKMVLAMLAAMVSLQARAERVAHDPAKFKAAKAACENSEYNTGGVTLPDRPQPGQRPQLTDAQRALIDACVQAGILPAHHGHHGPPPPPEE